MGLDEAIGALQSRCSERRRDEIEAEKVQCGTIDMDMERQLETWFSAGE
jgi:hypothetical protein